MMKICRVGVGDHSDARAALESIHPLADNHGWVRSPQVALSQDPGIEIRRYRHIKISQSSAKQVSFVGTHAKPAILKIAENLFGSCKLGDVIKINVVPNPLGGCGQEQNVPSRT
jgi:hypothetical protein